MMELTNQKGRMIGSSKEVDGLYLFEDEYGPKEKLQKNCLNSILIREDQEIMLWHYRLGHPNFLYSKHLFPDFSRNKNLNFYFLSLPLQFTFLTFLFFLIFFKI